MVPLPVAQEDGVLSFLTKSGRQLPHAVIVEPHAECDRIQAGTIGIDPERHAIELLPVLAIEVPDNTRGPPSPAVHRAWAVESRWGAESDRVAAVARSFAGKCHLRHHLWRGGSLNRYP